MPGGLFKAGEDSWSSKRTARVWWQTVRGIRCTRSNPKSSGKSLAKGPGDGERPLDMGEYRVESEGGGAKVEGIGRKYGEKRSLENVRWICEKIDGIRGWGRKRGNVGGVLGEKRMRREARDEVKGGRV